VRFIGFELTPTNRSYPANAMHLAASTARHGASIPKNSSQKSKHRIAVKSELYGIGRRAVRPRAANFDSCSTWGYLCCEPRAVPGGQRKTAELRPDGAKDWCRRDSPRSSGPPCGVSFPSTDTAACRVTGFTGANNTASFPIAQLDTPSRLLATPASIRPRSVQDAPAGQAQPCLWDPSAAQDALRSRTRPGLAATIPSAAQGR
jgi:hypothetical protein